jgi:hypothetical protein
MRGSGKFVRHRFLLSAAVLIDLRYAVPLIHAGGSLAGNESIEALLTMSYAGSALLVCERSFAVIGAVSPAVAEGLCVFDRVNEFFILISSYRVPVPSLTTRRLDKRRPYCRFDISEARQLRCAIASRAMS